MTNSEIQKAIEEEAERRFAYYVGMVKNSKEINYLRKGLREAFIEGAKFREELGLSIEPTTNLQQQNENERLNNSEALKKAEEEIVRLSKELKAAYQEIDDFLGPMP